MYKILILGVVVAIVGLIIEFLVKKSSKKETVHFVARDGYRKKDFVMNKSESAFFFELERQLPKGYHIFPKMRIADIIDATDGYGLRYRRNKILPKHIDFLICNSYLNPILGIELNGSSHSRQDRIERDELVNDIFRVAGLPLKTINLGEDFYKVSKDILETLSHV